MRYLGIDYGTKKVGLALSDEAGMMGFPKEVVPNTPSLATDLCVLIALERVGAVVIGESLNYVGVENEIARDARLLGDAIAQKAKIPVFYESEILTSAEARRQHEPTEKTRAPQTHPDVDASAAALILTSFLSKHHD